MYAQGAVCLGGHCCNFCVARISAAPFFLGKECIERPCCDLAISQLHTVRLPLSATGP